MNRDIDFISEIKALAEEKDIKKLMDKAGDLDVEPAFAAVYIAAEQTLKLQAFDEQLLAARALTERKVLELPTGEGKTLAAVFTAVWHKLCGRKVHILTFNDYLAKRDREWMKPIYDLLGVSSAFITEKSTFEERKAAYKCDVLYISARECCFDYLRDFTVQTANEAVGQGFSAAIVDEADSLMIDEARIPLVVSSDVAVKRDPQLAEALKLTADFDEEDYDISLENESVYLTDSGAAKVEERFGLDNLYDEENSPLLSRVNDCLKARFLLREDKDYIQRDGRILLIDKFTGRTSENRHYPGTLQTAVELKHGLAVSTRGMVMGSIALQFFVQQYRFLSAMTGTAEASKDEFYQLYDLTLEKVPPHLPSRRIDHETEIYYDSPSKWKAVAKAVCLAHEKGQPVLVGTGSIEDSELIHGMLKEQGIEASVLNAKNDTMEAQIISDAGAPYAVTISTNMAGRGVDIRLGGADESRKEEAVAAGGLLVISTHMPESSRMVKQLIGRAGRQGDPGESRSFVALDEPIMEKHKLITLVPARHWPEPTEEAIGDKVLRREVERIQRISEGDTFDARTRLLKYTMIGEKHREQVFEARRKFLEGDSPSMWCCSELYEQAVKRFGERRLEELERRTAVAAVNSFWSEYLEYTDYIRQGIHLTAVAGKSPAEEYNIAAEEYYLSMEDALRDFMEERLADLTEQEDDYIIEQPRNIRTYLLEDNSDELNTQPFLVSFLSDESEAELLAEMRKQSVLDAPADDNEEKPKRGFFKKLFGNK